MISRIRKAMGVIGLVVCFMGTMSACSNPLPTTSENETTSLDCEDVLIDAKQALTDDLSVHAQMNYVLDYTVDIQGLLQPEKGSFSAYLDDKKEFVNNIYDQAWKFSSVLEENYEGRSSYHLSGNIDGSLVQSIMQEMVDDKSLTIDFTDNTIPVEIWIDKKTMLPLAYNIELTRVAAAIKNKNDNQGYVFQFNEYSITFLFSCDRDGENILGGNLSGEETTVE